jgi:mannose-6-phosphate isomerase-like protein (cupin superfamily)
MKDTGEAVRAVVPADMAELDVFGSRMFVASDGIDLAAFVAEHVVPPGYAVPRHFHEVDDELFFVLEGHLTVIAPEGERTVGPGACIQLPRGIPHGYRNETHGSVRFLVMLVPGRQALEMFRHFDRAGAATKLSPAEIGAIAARYGVHLV